MGSTQWLDTYLRLWQWLGSGALQASKGLLEVTGRLECGRALFISKLECGNQERDFLWVASLQKGLPEFPAFSAAGLNLVRITHSRFLFGLVGRNHSRARRAWGTCQRSQGDVRASGHVSLTAKCPAHFLS